MDYQWIRTLGEKLMDAGNLGFGGLIVGQVIEQSLRLDRTLIGIVFWLGGYLIGASLIRVQGRLAIEINGQKER